jgi:hypothetical protein
MVDELAIPLTIKIPALAVIDPMVTSEVLAVMVDVLAMPLTVNVPTLAVTDPPEMIEFDISICVPVIVA